jgi:signal transduction histidine kinase
MPKNDMRFITNLNHSVAAKVWQLFIVAALTLAASLGTIYIELKNIRLAEAESQHVSFVIEELSTLSENLVDVETGQRGFLLTQKHEYLEPYIAAEKLINNKIKTLNSQIKDPDAITTFKLMQPIIAAKLNVTAASIALTKAGKIDEAMALVNAGSGRAYMDEFRHLRSKLIEREILLLNKKRDKYESELHYALISLNVSGVLAIIVMYIAALSATRQLKKPILALLKGFQALSEGKSEYKVEVKGKDEIARISSSFNEMAGHIVDSREIQESLLSELKRSNADLDKFAYVASHDLKAPLRGIRSLAQWIEEDVTGVASEETLENLGLLKNRVDRLDKLLESLLAYSRTGNKSQLPEVVNIPELVSEIRDYLASDSQFKITYEGNVSDLSTFRVPLELMFRNLINNAVKHHDMANGKVEVYARDIGSQIEFRITDDGPGIAPEFHERIFEMFQTLKPRDHTEGSGMGLAIVKKAVEHFGGRIWVESEPPKRGATFVVIWKK